VVAAALNAQDGAAAAHDPTNLVGGSGAGQQVDDYPSFLKGPSGSCIGGALNYSGRQKAPHHFSLGRRNELGISR
jgi:hypothetical protein